MEKELIINSSPTNVEIAILEDGKLVEIHSEKTNSKFTVGDIFLGSVKKLMPGLNAAFVDIGHRKDAFLHYTDLGPKLRSVLKFTEMSMKQSLSTHLLDNFDMPKDIDKGGKINQVLSKRKPLLVQILKEPISTKGPRLSCELTIPGRFLVLTPFSNMIAVSKKISNPDERKRLQVLIESIRPANCGVIVRTASEGKKVADLHEELTELLGKWASIYKQLHSAKPPVKLLSELDKTSSILRDMLTDDFNRIVINDADLFQNTRGYLKSIAPEKVNLLSMYRSRQPIFDKFGITRQIKSSFGKTSTMSSGAYLVIEHTEAMHVIDVNSGPKSVTQDQERSAVKVNIEAAKEIARQLRLRDIGGLIIIDFIDMRRSENRQHLYKSMREFMRNDRAQHTILPISKFGLMQITRERVRPEVKIDTTEKCPTCGGSGKVNATILVTDEIERDLDYIMHSRPKSKIKLICHPFVHAYLTRGLLNYRYKWYRRYGKWIKIASNAEFSIMKYSFYDGEEDEIRLN